MKLNDNVYMIVNNQDGAAITEQEEEEKPLKSEHNTTGTHFCYDKILNRDKLSIYYSYLETETPENFWQTII